MLENWRKESLQNLELNRMDNKTYEQISRYITTRIEVSDEELKMILSYFKPLRATKNEILVSEGQTSQRTFFVGQGCIRIYFINEEGHEATRYFAFENDLAAALMSFITHKPSPEYLQSVENSELLYMEHDDFFHLLKIIPSWEKFYRSFLEKAYVNNTNRLMSFFTMNATERYARLLIDNPELPKRLSNKMVASYLNLSPETLSRLKSKLQADE
jgi:CRP-like cAMP-binding protein